MQRCRRVRPRRRLRCVWLCGSRSSRATDCVGSAASAKLLDFTAFCLQAGGDERRTRPARRRHRRTCTWMKIAFHSHSSGMHASKRGESQREATEREVQAPASGCLGNRPDAAIAQVAAFRIIADLLLYCRVVCSLVYFRILRRSRSVA